VLVKRWGQTGKKKNLPRRPRERRKRAGWNHGWTSGAQLRAVRGDVLQLCHSRRGRRCGGDRGWFRGDGSDGSGFGRLELRRGGDGRCSSKLTTCRRRRRSRWPVHRRASRRLGANCAGSSLRFRRLGQRYLLLHHPLLRWMIFRFSRA